MSDYQVGSQEWLFDLYNQFLQAGDNPFTEGTINFPGGTNEDFQDMAGGGTWPVTGGNVWTNVDEDFMPSVEDWMAASESGTNPMLGELNLAGAPTEQQLYNYYINNHLGFLSSTDQATYANWAEAQEESQYWADPSLPGYGIDYEGGWNPLVMLNLNQWLADWGSNVPDYDPLDKQNALSIGRLKRRDNVWDILKNVNQAGSGMNKYINRPDSGKLQYLYDSALATGILSDFQTRSEIWDMEQDYISDVYSMLGETAAAGGFDWGEVNVGDYYTTTIESGDSGGESDYCATMCASVCDDTNSEECTSCLDSCFETGNV